MTRLLYSTKTRKIIGQLGFKRIVEIKETQGGNALREWDLQDTQTEGVVHVKVKGVLCFEFIPKLPHTKVLFVHMGVMKEHHRTRGEFGQPRLKVVLHRIIGVQPIDVQEVDALGRKVGQGFIEGFGQKR